MRKAGGGDLLYFLHVVPERHFDVIGGDAAETIINEDEDEERRAVCTFLTLLCTANLRC